MSVQGKIHAVGIHLDLHCGFDDALSNDVLLREPKPKAVSGAALHPAEGTKPWRRAEQQRESSWSTRAVAETPSKVKIALDGGWREPR